MDKLAAVCVVVTLRLAGDLRGISHYCKHT